LIASEVPLNLYCISCGYNQRGITSAHCPECGQDFSKVPPSPTRLPWLHRRYRGFLRSYWRTVMMVIFQPRLFREQIDNPIAFSDARRFWLLTIVFAYVPVVGAAVQIYHTPSQPGSMLREIQSLFIPLRVLPPGAAFLAGLFLFLTFATGLPSYFCHPRALPIERQNRAIALSYFASAPLALMPFIVASMLVAQVSAPVIFISITFRILAALIAVFMLGAWYIRTVGIVLALSQRRRRTLTVFVLNCAWVMVAAFSLVIVPLGLEYIVRMIEILF